MINNEFRCYGCGAMIQSNDIKKIGYVPKTILNKEEGILCQRCFKIKHYNKLQTTPLTEDDFLTILQSIGEKDAFIVYIIDLFDFNGSLIPGIQRHLMGNDILVVANKKDLLPKSLKDHKIINWIKGQFKELGLQPVDVVLTSAKKNYQLDELISLMNSLRKEKDVYIVGVTNVGKSTLLNALLKNYANEENYLITTSVFPGTTLDLIEIALDDTCSIYDTPGIINHHQMAHYVDEKTLEMIIPKNEINPATYQLNSQQSLYFGGLARMDFVSGEKTNFTCYFSKDIKIHRTKLENADGLYNRNKTLNPTIETITTINEMKTHSFNITKDMKYDLVISGFGWISFIGKKQKITIKTPTGVGVFLRNALV